MVEAIRQGDIPGVQLRHRRRLPLLVEHAWSWLITAELLERWACDRAGVHLDAEIALVLERAQGTGETLCEEGETLAFEAPRRWALAFRQRDRGWEAATRLTFGLTETADGCELDIFHEGFEQLSLSSCLTVWEEYRRRWREAGDRLAAAVSRGQDT